MEPKVEIEFAPQDTINELEPYVQKVLEAIAVAVDEPGIAGAWVSDESWISDFLGGETPEELEVFKSILRQKLGFEPGLTDRIYAVAFRLKQLEK